MPNLHKYRSAYWPNGISSEVNCKGTQNIGRLHWFISNLLWMRLLSLACRLCWDSALLL